MKNKKKKLKGMKANDLLVGILVVIVFIMLVLRYTIFKNSQFDFLPLISFIVVLGILIVSFINVEPTKKHEVFVEKGLGFGYTINPRNLFGLFLYIILLVATILPYFI